LADSVSAGIEHVRTGKWMAVAAPAGTPRPIIANLYSAIAKGFARPEAKGRVAQLQIELLGSTPDQMAAIVKATRERWRPAITEAKIVIE
jgi:tripartite-type tricarboxylate transporter receptor subunit TctC